jgi:sialate O-acetylesterase
MKNSRFQFIAILFLLFLITVNVHANVSLPQIFSDNMVLQQKSDVIFWGWAKPFENVIIKASWLESELSIKAENQGTWKLALKTPSAGGPYTVIVKGYNEIVFKNVMIGEVWLCSGQSNMEWSAQSGIINGEEEIKNASYPDIRFFTVLNSTALYPQDHLTGEWTVCTPETMKTFSAIGYFFARKLQKELGIPVGIINSSWGGTPAEAWMPEEVIMNDPFLREAAAKQKPVPWGPVETARIYNSMIYPLLSFRIAGALWYQGEANTINAYAYEKLLSGLIGSWRNKWGYEFPFYYAQIAPYKYGKPFEGVEVREAQRKVLEVSGTGMVVLSDIGDTLDIHPKNKQDAALRFANLALNRHYKKTDLEDSGPLYKGMIVEKSTVVISFENSTGLNCKDKKVSSFEVAGEDKIFYSAEAKIKGEQVMVKSEKVKSPRFVRFAWSNTATPNLFNGANLPASCFTTE